jgi:hypothetical protein
MARPVLVTGAAGYIGSVLVRQLLARGTTVRAVDALMFGGESIIELLDDPRFEFRKADVRDAAAMAEARRGRGCGRPPRRHRRRSRLRAPAGAGRERQLRRLDRSSTGWPRPRAWTLRVRLDLLELRQVERPDAFVNRDGPSSTRLALRPDQGRRRGAPAGRRRGALRPDLPALLHRLRAVAPAALRPDRQRVHPRPRPRSRARRVRRAVLAPLLPRPRPGPQRGDGPGGRRRRRRLRRVQRRRQRRELPQADDRRAHPGADPRRPRAVRREGRGPARLPRRLRQDPRPARLQVTRRVPDGIREIRGSCAQGFFLDPDDPASRTSRRPPMDVDLVRRRLREVLGDPAAFVGLHEPRIDGHAHAYVVLPRQRLGVERRRLRRPLRARAGRLPGRPKHAVATVNGTAALHLALHVVGVRPGDHVLVPDAHLRGHGQRRDAPAAPSPLRGRDRAHPGHGPAGARRLPRATAERRGGRPFDRASGRRIAACVPMHTFGHPVEMDALLEVCERWGIPVVEDAAESLGSTWRGRHAGPSAGSAS